MAPHLEQTIRLAGGRTLGYAEFGAAAGAPVFYFHGWPGSRLEWPLFDPADLAVQLGLRLVAVDRPGYGLSDPQPGRRLLDWPADVVEVAAALELAEFSILGYSGGTPFALACAFKLAPRLKRVLLVSAAAPFQVPGVTAAMPAAVRLQYTLARRLPALYRLMWRQITPPRFLEGAMRTLPAPDVQALQNPAVQQPLLAGLAEARRSDMAGAAVDGALISSPWGFAVSEITAPVWLWHGGLDTEYPLPMAQHLAAVIPGCQAFIQPKEGHLSVAVNHSKEILFALAQAG